MADAKFKPRTLKFKSEAELLDDVRRLRRGCRSHGNWSFPQIAWHLRNGMEASLAAPANSEPTAEQKAMHPVIDEIINTGAFPPGLPPPPGMIPPNAGLTDAETDALIAAIEKLFATDQSHGSLGRVGPLPIDKIRAFHLVHAANHLSYLMPAPPPRALKFDNLDQVVAEVEKLRKGYRKTGVWTLAQTCGHLAAVMEFSLTPPPPGAVATPEQTARRQDFIKSIQAGRSGKFSAPPTTVPSPDAGDDQIERFLADIKTLKEFPHKEVMMGPLGPAPVGDAIAAHLAHAAHHLGFLLPSEFAPRENLTFSNIDEVIADINHLRKGYVRTGSWSLAQICWHIAETTERRMVPPPFPDNTPEQDARRPMLESVLKGGKLPAGNPAPDIVRPPADCKDDCIDRAIDTLRRFDAYKAQLAPHRMFGKMSDSEMRKLNLIHCANHLKWLVPTT